MSNKNMDQDTPTLDFSHKTLKEIYLDYSSTLYSLNIPKSDIEDKKQAIPKEQISEKQVLSDIPEAKTHYHGMHCDYIRKYGEE